MKNTMCLALAILAVLPASAQKASDPNVSASGDVTPTQDYAARVDGLLREVHANLQKISAQLQAGQITGEQERELKLAATRQMIARLDALAAIYDARLDSNARTGASTASMAADVGRSHTAEHATINASRTVSVEDLKRQGAAVTVMPAAQEVAR